ncbi:Uncharacterised protein [Rhodococcus wratislaviensis]|uniref:Secreted protein n=1 Tax=Rhodococcus wratislaviensis TaxID=44752 RepID=A0AB38F9P0_RHOWR|nr:Uncharacterised protein [Rhodococcus wratislaviensis]
MQLTTLWWSMVTPFGVPVDPEVYITYAVLSGRSGLLRSLSPGAMPSRRATSSECASSNNVGMPLSGSVRAVVVSVRTRIGEASVRMNAVRALG